MKRKQNEVELGTQGAATAASPSPVSSESTQTSPSSDSSCLCTCFLPQCAGLLKTARALDAERHEKVLLANCAICLDVLYEPVSITCGHTFCLGCLLRVADKRCPACRTNFVEYPKVNNFISNWLNKELHGEVMRRRNELLRELSREASEGYASIQNGTHCDEPMFDNERLLRECNRREEEHRRRVQQVLHEQAVYAQRQRAAAQAQAQHRRAELARLEIQSAFSMTEGDLVF